MSGSYALRVFRSIASPISGRRVLTSQGGRPFHLVSTPRYPYKGTEDRTTLKPERSEETESGRTSDVAADDSSFDPSRTDPESEKEAAGGGAADGNPLEVSGANQGVSKPQGDERNGDKSKGAGKEIGKGEGSRSSKAGTGPKSKQL